MQDNYCPASDHTLVMCCDMIPPIRAFVIAPTHTATTPHLTCHKACRIQATRHTQHHPTYTPILPPHKSHSIPPPWPRTTGEEQAGGGLRVLLSAGQHHAQHLLVMRLDVCLADHLGAERTAEGLPGHDAAVCVSRNNLRPKRHNAGYDADV